MNKLVSAFGHPANQLLIHHSIAARHPRASAAASLLALGLMLGASAPAQAASFVDVRVNSSSDTSANGDGFCTLREAIDLSNMGTPALGLNANGCTVSASSSADANSVSFASNVTGTLNLSQGQIQISAAVNLVGPGADRLTLRARQSGGVNVTGARIFYIGTDAASSISGLTLSGGNPDGGPGAAIYSLSDLSLGYSTVTGNSSDSNTFGDAPGGGGLAVLGRLSLSHSTVSNNSSNAGGGVWVQGEAIISDSTISGNTTDANSCNATITGMSSGCYAGGGGGLWVQGSLSLSNSTVSGNSDSGTSASDLFYGQGGGGVKVLGTATLNNSTVAQNSTLLGYGGGLNVVGTLVLNNSTVYGNSAGYANGRDGGALFVRGAATLNNSTVSDNRSYGATAGSLYLSANGATPTSLSLNNSIISDSSSIPACGGDGDFSISANHSLATDNSCGNSTVTTPAALNLGPLADNDGPTQTIALLAGSAALHAGNPATCLRAPINGLDQRGYYRPLLCSAGAWDAGTKTRVAGSGLGGLYSPPSDGGGSMSLWSVLALALLGLGRMLRRKGSA